MDTIDGRKRVIIEGVSPEIDCGRYPVKRTIGESVIVRADIFADGHDALRCELLFRHENESDWSRKAMEPLVNDRWKGEFSVGRIGKYSYTIEAWVDSFLTWRNGFRKKVEAGQDDSVEIMMGINLIRDTIKRAAAEDVTDLEKWLTAVAKEKNFATQAYLLLDESLRALMDSYPDRHLVTRYTPELSVTVDRERARFGAWYEMFPRSCGGSPGKHGTFKECETRLPYIADMGFDVLYLPPIHPIGKTYRKGRNNATVASPEDVGSPWAIGSVEGGHKSIHPELGTVDDLRSLVDAARRYNIEIALDIAFQCSPDHPYVQKHPEWFRWRPDNSVQYAENPPKKYQDIYPLEFETSDWKALWKELKSVLEYWAEQGIRIFRVDNPHTKPFAFWEWVISEVKHAYPETLFLAEAFTRQKVMKRLAKLGFTQSYSYFAWRNTSDELRQYFTELTSTDVREYFRPNLWPNTPDILTEYLQIGGRSGFMVRLILAATLGANYGIYGPAFELCENRAREFGSEEYMDSEKYELRQWAIDSPESLAPLIRLVNTIRRENPALHGDWSLRFHTIDNEHLICYSKQTTDLSNVILVIVNLDVHHTHSGWLEIPLREWGLEAGQAFQVHDLLSNAHYLWHGHRNFVELDPRRMPAQIFRVKRRIRTERDFDYFM